MARIPRQLTQYRRILHASVPIYLSSGAIHSYFGYPIRSYCSTTLPRQEPSTMPWLAFTGHFYVDINPL